MRNFAMEAEAEEVFTMRKHFFGCRYFERRCEKARKGRKEDCQMEMAVNTR